MNNTISRVLLRLTRGQKPSIRRRKTSWKLYLLLAITLLILLGCRSETLPVRETDTSLASPPVSTTTSQWVSSPVRSLPATAHQTRVLILHDSGGPWGYVGKEHAMLLENLLGHFDVTTRVQPVSLYSAGQVNQFSATFYLGTTYDEPAFYGEGSNQRSAYSAFLNDVVNTSSTVVWMNHNLWQLAWNWPLQGGLEDFSARFGFQYNGLVNLQYNRVIYQGTELGKAQVHFAHPGAVLEGCLEEADGQYACDPVLNKVKITDNTRVTVHASAYSTLQAEAGYTPYIVQSGKFWYVGDLPFLHHSVRDRYLAFADLLYDILGVTPSQTEQTALLRLENIHPRTSPENLSQVLEYLRSENIPYAAAITPKFVDNNKDSRGVSLAGSQVAPMLQTHHDSGLMSVVANGLTHQWEGGDNPRSGKTGDNFEFYRVSRNDDLSLNYEAPLDDDQSSANRTRKRLTEARALLNDAGLDAFAWKAPADMASEADFLAAQEAFGVYYGRVHYFSPQGPEGRFVGQMFPWLVQRDRYDYRIVPENLGGIRSNPEPSYESVDALGILENADHLAVVRGHLASFAFDVEEPLSELKMVVDGLRERGYRFEHPCVLGYQCNGVLAAVRYLKIDTRGGGQRIQASTDSLDVTLAPSAGTASQAWQVVEFDDLTMQLKSAATKKCLSVAGSHISGTALTQAMCSDHNQNQRWKQYGSDLRNRATGQCLDVSLVDNVITAGNCDNRATQQWSTHWQTAE